MPSSASSPPHVERLVAHREANTFALLIVALLERGAPMPLVEVAGRRSSTVRMLVPSALER